MSLLFLAQEEPNLRSFVIAWGPFVILVVLVYFFLLRGSRKQQKQAVSDYQAELKRQQEHRERVEAHLRRIVELLEERKTDGPGSSR